MSIQSEITRISSAKIEIGTAITNKGVTVPSGTKIDGMATLIGQIQTGGGQPWAAISVTYPAGSTCTATNGTTMLTAADTSGQVVFGIPEPASTPETWTVSCTNGTDSDSKAVSINTYGQTEEVELNYLVIGATLNDTTWENISKVSIAGTGDTYWDVGDCKAVTLNGKIGDHLTLSNTTLYVFILDFNHPINKTTADNNIIFGGFKTALIGGVDVALCDSGYGSGKASGKYFNLNHTQVNTTVQSTTATMADGKGAISGMTFWERQVLRHRRTTVRRNPHQQQALTLLRLPSAALFPTH